MGIDLATTNAPFGLIPWGNVLEAHMYCIVDPVASGGIFHGDLVEHGGTTLATPAHGQLVEAVMEAEGASGSLLGGVLAVFDVNYDPQLYLAGAATGNGTIAGYVLVADHPNQLYLCQEDGDTGSLQIADMGILVELVTGTGSTVTGRSGMMLDGNGGTSNPAVRVIKAHPDDTISAAGAASNYCRFVVELCTSYRAGDLGAI